MQGRVLANKYKLLQYLARGGNSSIYLAEHIHLHEKRAIKILRPRHEHKKDFISRFFREIRVTHQASRRSEHIVRIYDDFDVLEQVGCYYVMEYLEGETLAERLDQEQGFQDESWCAHIILQVCRAMQVVHDLGIVHRDLKPENLVLIQRPEYADFVKLLDFGIALPPEGAESVRLTRPGMTHGTPLYMSPEQIMGPPSAEQWDSYLDGRSDQYSLACILFELLTGRPPFLKRRDDPEYVLYQHLNGRTPSVCEIRSDLSPEWDRILQRAMRKKPDERYSSMQEMARAIESLTFATRPGISRLDSQEMQQLRDVARQAGLLKTAVNERDTTTENNLPVHQKETHHDLTPWSDATPIDTTPPSTPLPQELISTAVDVELDEDHPLRQLLSSRSLGAARDTQVHDSSPPDSNESWETLTPVSETPVFNREEEVGQGEEAPIILLTNPRFKNAPVSKSPTTVPRQTSVLIPRSSAIKVEEDELEDD